MMKELVDILHFLIWTQQNWYTWQFFSLNLIQSRKQSLLTWSSTARPVAIDIKAVVAKRYISLTMSQQPLGFCAYHHNRTESTTHWRTESSNHMTVNASRAWIMLWEERKHWIHLYTTLFVTPRSNAPPFILNNLIIVCSICWSLNMQAKNLFIRFAVNKMLLLS